MNNELPMRRPEHRLVTAAYEDAAPQESIFSKLHRLLRGHYKWCIPLAIVLGAVGATCGYRAARPLWSSTGTIQIISKVRPKVEQTFETQDLPQQFKDTQIALMRNQRVIDKAMYSADWKALGRDITSDAALADFNRKLKVTPVGRADIISVTFADEDPKAAVAGARGVVSAYFALYGDRESKESDVLRRELEARQGGLSSELRTKRENLHMLAMRNYGTDDLRSIHSATVDYIAKIKIAMDEGNIALAALNAAVPATQPARRKRPAEMTVEDIAAIDQPLQRLLLELDNLEFELNSAMELGHLGEKHAEVRGLRARVERKKYEIDRYAKLWHGRMDHSTDAIELRDPSLLHRDQLEARQSHYKGLLVEAEQASQSLGKEMFEMERLRKDIENLDRLIAQTRDRIDQVRTEGQDRVVVVSEGDRAILAKDNRLQYAAAGGVGGIGAALALAMLISLLDRRFRTPDDARSSSKLALLGVLPNLPEDLDDPHQAAMASHCVHQLRTLLQIASERRVFVVTSPASGSGKTSLTLSLGVSFAAANCRTLLVDCDLVGGGLTTRIDAVVQRKIGQILRQQGSIDDRQLQSALKVAQTSRKKLGETLVDLGYLSADDLARALAEQGQIPMGVLDALRGEGLKDCVAESGLHGLDILPVGSALPSDVSRLSPAMVHTLIEQARRHYDVVLIDTGPVPGSLEASVVAACADAVVIVLSRGEQRGMAERCIQHLQEVGARLAGVVFNRAQDRDVDLSSTAHRVSSANSGRSQAAHTSRTAGQPRMGPMALAVTNRAPFSRSSPRPPQE